MKAEHFALWLGSYPQVISEHIKVDRSGNITRFTHESLKIEYLKEELGISVTGSDTLIVLNSKDNYNPTHHEGHCLFCVFWSTLCVVAGSCKTWYVLFGKCTSIHAILTFPRYRFWNSTIRVVLCASISTSQMLLMHMKQDLLHSSGALPGALKLLLT